MGETLQFTDRYQALGMPYPDPATMCQGQCEGTGIYPQHRDDQTMTVPEWNAWRDCHADSCGPRGRLRSLWRGLSQFDRFYLRAALTRCDGWHFITCPTCGGSGRR